MGKQKIRPWTHFSDVNWWFCNDLGFFSINYSCICQISHLPSDFEPLHSTFLQMKVLTWFMRKKEFKGSPQLHINWWYGESTAFKDFILQQQCRFNRFSQSASWAWSVMCVLVLLRVYICASANYSVREIFMVKGTEWAVSGFLRTKGGARAPAAAPRLPSWHRSWVETQIHGESAAFPLGPNREHMSHAGFSHRQLDRTVRRARQICLVTLSCQEALHVGTQHLSKWIFSLAGPHEQDSVTFLECAS